MMHTLRQIKMIVATVWHMKTNRGHYMQYELKNCGKIDKLTEVITCTCGKTWSVEL